MKIGPLTLKRWRDTLAVGVAGRWYLYMRLWREP